MKLRFFYCFARTQSGSVPSYQCLHLRIVYLYLLFICGLFPELNASIISCVFDILLLCWCHLNLDRIMSGVFGCVCRLKLRIWLPHSNGKSEKMDFLIKRTFCCDHDKNYVSQFHSIQYAFGFCSQDLFFYMAKYASERDEANPAFWLAIQTGNMGSSCPLGISRVGPASKSSLFGHIINLLLTKIVRSRWLNIVLVIFCLRFYRPRLRFGQ